MRKFKMGGGIAVLLIVALDKIIRFLMHNLVIPINLNRDYFGDEEEEESSPRLSEREEAERAEAAGPGAVPIQLNFVNFGDLEMECPQCNTLSNEIAIGIGLAEDKESGEGEINDIQSIGVVTYPCGHAIYSRCLTDKIAIILNEGDKGHLFPEMFAHLTYCEEHGDPDGESEE